MDSQCSTSTITPRQRDIGESGRSTLETNLRLALESLLFWGLVALIAPFVNPVISLPQWFGQLVEIAILCEVKETRAWAELPSKSDCLHPPSEVIGTFILASKFRSPQSGSVWKGGQSKSATNN